MAVGHQLPIVAKVAAHYRTEADRQQIAVSRKCDKIAVTTNTMQQQQLRACTTLVVAIAFEIPLLPWH